MAEYQSVTGLSDCLGRIKALPMKLRQKVLQGATYQAAVTVRDMAKELAPVYHGDVSQGHPPPGTLRKSIIAKVIKEKSNDHRVTVYVTVKKGHTSIKQLIQGKMTPDPYYWWWVEFGTNKMEGQHYMTRSFIIMAPHAIEVFRREVVMRLDEVVK